MGMGVSEDEREGEAALQAKQSLERGFHEQ